MADAAVEFLLQNLQQLLMYHAKLIIKAKDKIVELDEDLRLFQAFLRGSTKKRRKDDSLRELVRQIRDVVYEAEDIIDAFVTQAAENKSKNFFARSLQTPAKLLTIAKEVEKLGTKIRGIYGDKVGFATLGVGDGDPDIPEVPIIKKENIVGFEDEALKLSGFLLDNNPKQLDVISIVGMPGLGKTTLASKIFHDPAIQYEFPTRIWVYISQEFTKKDVFLNILGEFTRLSGDMYKKTDDQLAQIIINHLEKSKFLIVMDDVWTPKDWDELQIALPKSNNMGKVLITSRNEDVAQHANRRRDPLKLRFLNQDESWLLLRYEVFGDPDECPSDLEVPGELIAQRCGGLPLALVVIGGILLKKALASNEMLGKKEAWIKVSESVGAYLKEDPQERMERIISMSYYKLPFHLRACFLYFGMFPEDFEIPVWKLIRMWIAEGFVIQQKNSKISLEETAESYLEDLISRNLVRVDKSKSNGKAKTCRIHDMLRDFCILEGGSERENLLQEVKNNDGVFEPQVCDLTTYRRLCIHSNVSNFLGNKPVGPRVRSFVCYSKEDINLEEDNFVAIPKAFKLLRVLDVNPVKLKSIPSDFYHLVHLRYIILSFNVGTLPEEFSKLWNVQTLIIDTTSRTLDIKANIWKLGQLRCFKTNASATLANSSKSSKEASKLQTLGTISPKDCTEEVFERARSLKKLGIRGRLSLLLEGKTVSFDSLGRLNYLEKLKLLNDVFPRPPSDGKLRRLPLAYNFPPELRSLTLANTFLEWRHMSVLGLLPNLAVLKLKDKAFMGSSWEACNGDFRNLQVLEIWRTNLAVWKASGHHFPKLRQLELYHCEVLKEVPIGFAEIPSLKLLIMHRSKFAAASAKKISLAREKKLSELKQKKLDREQAIKINELEQEKLDKEPIIKFSELKLSIFPPDE